MVPITGIDGVTGCEIIVTPDDETEVHPSEFVTVYVYVLPAGIPETVVFDPVPVVVTPPGFLVSVHEPEEGSPLNATLPVANAQVGWVIIPTTGAVGVTGCTISVTLDDAAEVHPLEFVTVYVYVLPAGIPVTVVLAPVPVVVTPPGFRVRVHVPDDGRPLSATLPVATVQVGWVMVPTTGAEGVTGCVLITTLPEDPDVHPSEFVTVYVYVPGARPDMVVLVPVPVVVAPPGLRVRVHVPEAGNPLSTTLPVETAHVGWVVVDTTGAVGVAGCAGITTLADSRDVHPASLVTV